MAAPVRLLAGPSRARRRTRGHRACALLPTCVSCPPALTCVLPLPLPCLCLPLLDAAVIRHEGFLLWVRPRDGAPVYAADASFKPKGGCAKRLLALASGRAYDDTSSSSDSSDSD